MAKFFKGLLFLGALLFIALNVYVATLPSVNSCSHKLSCQGMSVPAVNQQIINFENWQKMALTDSIQLFVAKNREPMLNQLKVVLQEGDTFTVENQLITDTLIVQHIYGLGSNKASVLRWRLSQQACLTLELKEWIGNKQKLLHKLGAVAPKSEYIQQACKRLLSFKSAPKISTIEELETFIAPKRQITTDTIIRIPKQN